MNALETTTMHDFKNTLRAELGVTGSGPAGQAIAKLDDDDARRLLVALRHRLRQERARGTKEGARAPGRYYRG